MTKVALHVNKEEEIKFKMINPKGIHPTTFEKFGKTCSIRDFNVF